MKRRVAEVRKTAKGRQWRCLLCDAKGVGADDEETTALFEAHYAKAHAERNA